ncbi:hypothetical protein FRC06_006546 [Ceratobasidium sp. 370]|nr:hypothetical protein FRC06_006546 [Ceratobasidium sp. 370]
MPPSRKRQSTPPVSSSPVKRPQPSLPATPPPALPAWPSRDGSPAPEEPRIAAKWWISDFHANIKLLLQPLTDGSLPFVDDALIFAKVCVTARNSLREATTAIEHQLTLVDSPVNTDRSTQTEEPALRPPLSAPLANPDTPAIPPPRTPGDDDLCPVPRTYAQAVGATPATRPPNPAGAHHRNTRTRGHTRPPTSPGPICLIVRPPSADKQAPAVFFAPLLEKGPAEPHRRLAHALAHSPATRKVTLLGVHQNRKGNLVASFPRGTTDADIARATPVIKNVLAVNGAAPTLQRDTPWSKLLVSSIITRLEPEAPTIAEAEVLSSFVQNPLIRNLKITLNPRWVRNPTSITGPRSSFTFAFEDQDGSLARSLVKSPLFIFGNPVRVRKWVDKRPPRS